MNYFNPEDYIKGLYQVLMSDKKRIGFLFGAGCSFARKEDSKLFIPAIGELTSQIVSEASDIKQIYKTAINEIKTEVGKVDCNIEQILSNIENKKAIIGNGKLNGLKAEEFVSLYKEITDKVREKVSIHKEITDDNFHELLYVDFAKWIARANRKHSIEIFTSNYDYLIEVGLESEKVPYYDGFTGSYEPFFNPQSVHDMCFLNEYTKLWKIHGSLGWKYNSNSGYITRMPSSSDDILIYPSILKYNQSQKQPYVSLMDRLSDFIRQEDSILIICGYSFCDEHINERIISALKSNPRSHVVGLLYDEYKISNNGKLSLGYSLTHDSIVSKLAMQVNNISIYGIRNAVIGCKHGNWKLSTEPSKEDTPNINLYFDEDAPELGDVEMNKEFIGDEIWTGEGRFILPDFGRFISFLNSMIWSNGLEGDNSVQ